MGEWKYDLEESDLMQCFMRTWKDEGYIANIILEEFICSPPFGQTGKIRDINIGKFEKSRYIKYTDRSGEYDSQDPAYYHAQFGDPNYKLELEYLKMEEVPIKIIDLLFAETIDPLKRSIIL